ncbi:hypothetical protein [Candidatus Oscillochloris fontis]|nr:hypothetical protein [Candidatus Oscillochloris fontis]
MELIIALVLFSALVATWFVLPATAVDEPAEKSGVVVTSSAVAHTA